MKRVPTHSEDPAALAAAVRVLARDARRLLADPAPQSHQVRELKQRATVLGAHFRRPSGNPLGRWVAALRARLDTLPDPPASPLGAWRLGPRRSRATTRTGA